MNRWSMLICALIFSFEQNFYFGWNAFPKSDAELIADGICLLMIGLSFRQLESSAQFREAQAGGGA